MLKHLKSIIAARKLIAVLVVAMLMVAMACNGEEDPTATSPATEAPMPDPTATEAMMLTDPLVIGHLNAFTGSLSYFGETHLNAVNLAAKHINDAGGIHGAQIEVIEKDTGVNPVQGVDAARALVSIDGGGSDSGVVGKRRDPRGG